MSGNIDFMVETLATRSSLNSVSERLNEYSEIGHVKRLKTELVPKIEEFSNMVHGLFNDNEKVKEITRKFDETICKKANKSEIQILK